MKYVITGGAGHVSKPLVENLLAAGAEVTVIGRNPENLKPLTDKGAKAAIGSVDDVSFLTDTFAGADAIYTMVPPNFGATNWKDYIEQVGKNFAEAIKGANIKYVVNLSSVGAHLPEGCGPVTGLHRVEQVLNKLEDVNIKHLRPAFFFDNFLGNLQMVKQMNIIGGNYGDAAAKMVLTSPADIAAVAAEELLHLNFKGHSIRYIASDVRTTGDVAKVIGAAVGKPELPWVEFTDKQSLEGMQQAGLPQEIAKNYTEMGHAMRSGKMQEDYLNNQPETLGKTKLEDFAKTFAGAYNAS